MSRGIGGNARIVDEDDELIMYEYSVYNWNIEEHKKSDHIYDGAIWIERSCFIEPEIHEKIKRTPGGRKKLVVKCIPQIPDYGKMISDGKIKIKNASHFFGTTLEGIDIMAMHLLYKILRQYQEDGKIPDRISYFT